MGLRRLPRRALRVRRPRRRRGGQPCEDRRPGERVGDGARQPAESDLRAGGQARSAAARRSRRLRPSRPRIRTPLDRLWKARRRRRRAHRRAPSRRCPRAGERRRIRSRRQVLGHAAPRPEPRSVRRLPRQPHLRAIGGAAAAPARAKHAGVAGLCRGGERRRTPDRLQRTTEGAAG